MRRIFGHARGLAYVGVIVAGITAHGVARADLPKSHAAGSDTSAPPSPSAAPTGTPGGATIADPTPIPVADEEASTRFKRGLQLFDEGDYTLALVEFERAYQLAPNYRALYNISLVDVQLGRYADASRILEQYLHDGGAAIPAARRAEVVKTLGELKVRTATAEITANVNGAEISLDGKPLDPSLLRTPMLLDAGEHTLRATAPGYAPAYRTLTLAGADHTTVYLTLFALPPQKAPMEAPQEKGRTLFWPGFVATGVLAAGAIVSGAVMLDARSRLSTQESTTGSPQSLRQSTANEVNGVALAADILTGLAVVTGSVSLYLSLRVDHSPKTVGQSAGIGAVGLTLSPRELSFSATF